MEHLADLAAYSFPLFSLLMAALLLIAREIGYALGAARAPAAGSAGEGAGLIVGSILGLVAFVLAMTLSFSASRMTERRDGALQEANAIGTAWLQATAIGDPRGAAIAARLEEYIAVRRAFGAASRHDPALPDLVAQTGALQSAIWTDVAALVAERRDAPATSLMNAVNHVFDMSTAETLALGSSVPVRLVSLLMLTALVGMTLLGYRLGLMRQPLRGLSVMMAVLWTAVMVQILDLGMARIGFYRTDLRAYDWTAAGMVPAPATAPAPAASGG